MIFRQERSNHSVLRNFWHKETVRGMTAASPWDAGFFSGQGAQAKRLQRRRGKASRRRGKGIAPPSRETGRDEGGRFYGVPFPSGEGHVGGRDSRRGEVFGRGGPGEGPFFRKGFPPGCLRAKQKPSRARRKGFWK